MGGLISLDQLLAVASVLARPMVRISAFIGALPLGWLGRWLLPRTIPVGQQSELWQSDLGRVAPGLFLTLLSILCATAFLVGTVTAAVREFDRHPVVWAVGNMAVAIAVMAGCLYLAGLAVSWVGATCMLLGACGGLLSFGQYLAVARGPGSGGPSVGS